MPKPCLQLLLAVTKLALTPATAQPPACLQAALLSAGWGVASSYKRTGLLEDTRVGLELMVTAVFEWVRNALRTVALLPRRAGQHQHQQHQQPAPHSKEAAAAAGNLPRSHSAQACLVSARAALLHRHVKAQALLPQQPCQLQHPQCQTPCTAALPCAYSALQYR